MKRIISILLIALLALTGCQAQMEVPAAESEAERLIAQAQTTHPAVTLEKKEQPAEEGISPLYAKLGAPERFVPEVDAGSDKISVEVDAKVVLPDTDGLPVAKVQPAQFSQETVDALFELFCGDTVMYDTSDSGYTRDDILGNLEMWQGRLNDEDSLMRENARGMVELLEAQLETMPEDVEEMVSSAELREMVYSFGTPDVGRYMGVDTVERPEAEPGESDGKRFMIRNDYHIMDWKDPNIDFGPATGAYARYYDNDTNDRLRGQHSFTLINAPEDVPDEALQQLGMTPEEAAELVQESFREAGLELAVDKVYLNTVQEYGTTVMDGVEYETEPSEDSPTCYRAYVVTLGQVMGGAASRTVTEAQANNGKNESSMEPSWFYQRIECEIYDGGIQNFTWRGPMEEVEVVAEEAALLPFEEIAGIFEAMMDVEYAGYLSDADLLGIDVKVDRVELELQRITPDSSVTEGLLVPVWNFYGSMDRRYSWGAYSSNDTMDLPRAMLTINAIDGSVIDIFMGY